LWFQIAYQLVKVGLVKESFPDILSFKKLDNRDLGYLPTLEQKFEAMAEISKLPVDCCPCCSL